MHDLLLKPSVWLEEGLAHQFQYKGEMILRVAKELEITNNKWNTEQIQGLTN